MTAEQAISNICEFPFDEQLKVVQAIWDRLPEASALTLNDNARREMDRRVASYNSDPSTERILFLKPQILNSA